MAGETTTSTMDDISNVHLVTPVLLYALSEQPGLYKFARQFDVQNAPAVSFQVPTQTAYWGTPGDHGAGADTEFDGAGQMTAQSYTSVATGNVQCTPAEYRVAHGVADNVFEDSALGVDLMQIFTQTMTKVLAIAWEDDFLALLISLSNLVGSSGVDLSLAQLIAAQQGIRTRGALADQLAYILDNQQASDMDAAFLATGTSMAVYALSADRMIGYQPTGDNGMGPSRQIATVRGAGVFATGLTDTANTGADVSGACITPSTPVNDAAGSTTYGMWIKRAPRLETQRQALKVGTDIVMSARVGFAELQDGSGTSIVTDA